MTAAELFALTGRLRRQFPRVADVLTICDEVERLNRVNAVNVNATVNTAAVNAVNVSQAGPTARSDMAAYMRAYRAKKRTAA